MITCNYPRIWWFTSKKLTRDLRSGLLSQVQDASLAQGCGLLCQGGPGFRIDCVSTSWGLFQKVGWNWLVVGLKHLGLIYPYLGWFEANVYGMFWDRLKPQGPEFRRQSAFFSTYCSPIVQLSNCPIVQYLYYKRGKAASSPPPMAQDGEATNKFDTESLVLNHTVSILMRSSSSKI